MVIQANATGQSEPPDIGSDLMSARQGADYTGVTISTWWEWARTLPNFPKPLRMDKISKQIFFISINASIEAGRAGEAGRGFTQISTDIRALAQSAQDATRNLSSLVRQQD